MDVTGLLGEWSGPRTVVVGNGAFPADEGILQLLHMADHIVCCDGAVDKLARAGFEPTALVGDCDSMTTESLQRWKHCLFPDRSQEYNDLQKALKFCITHQMRQAVLLGCDGLREDHFIANLSIMATYSDRLALKMITGHGIFHVLRSTATLPCTPGQQISVFSLDKDLPLTFHSLKYPVNNRCFEHLWEGSLNEALDNEFTIELHKPGIVLAYVNY